MQSRFQLKISLLELLLHLHYSLLHFDLPLFANSIQRTLDSYESPLYFRLPTELSQIFFFMVSFNKRQDHILEFLDPKHNILLSFFLLRSSYFFLSWSSRIVGSLKLVASIFFKLEIFFRWTRFQLSLPSRKFWLCKIWLL